MARTYFLGFLGKINVPGTSSIAEEVLVCWNILLTFDRQLRSGYDRGNNECEILEPCAVFTVSGCLGNRLVRPACHSATLLLCLSAICSSMSNKVFLLSKLTTWLSKLVH